MTSYEGKIALLEVIDELFIFNKTTVSINPEITLETISNIINRVQKSILELYLNCQSKHKKSKNIFKALYENRQFINTKQQIDYLNNSIEENLANI